MRDHESSGITRSEPEDARAGSAFLTTRWTLVVGSQGRDTTVVSRALEELCQTYWRPVHAFIRRRGHAVHEAQDLTQEFFARLLASDGLQRADPARGRFRSFLLSAVKHFLANEWDKAKTLKRGGGEVLVPIRAGDDTTGLGVEPAGGESPERAYDRQWALSVLDAVLDRMQREHAEAGKEAVFEALKGTLTTGRREVSYATLGAQLGLSEGAVKVVVHRLRQRYRAVLREEIASTLEDPSRAEEELKELFAALSG